MAKVTLNTDWFLFLEGESMDRIGRIMYAATMYIASGTVPEMPAEDMLAFKYVKTQIDKALEMSKRNSRAGRASAEKRGECSTHVQQVFNTCSTDVQHMFNIPPTTPLIVNDTLEKKEVDIKISTKKEDDLGFIDDFLARDKFAEWLAWRRKVKRKPIRSPKQVYTAAFKRCGQSHERLIAAMDYSMSMEWDGIFEDKNKHYETDTERKDFRIHVAAEASDGRDYGGSTL